MSGAEFTRKKYDDYNRRLKQSTQQLYYKLDPSQRKNCHNYVPFQSGKLGMNGVSVSASRSIVDVESDLKNITRKISDNPHNQYFPVSVSEPLIHYQETNEIDELNCRLENPPSNNRERAIFEKYVYIDPQDLGMISSYNKATKNPGKTNLDTKTLYKDHFRPDLIFPNDVDESIIFDTAENWKYADPNNFERNTCIKIKNDNICGVFTGNLNDLVFTPRFCSYPQ
jgi:hypothetical protein